MIDEEKKKKKKNKILISYLQGLIFGLRQKLAGLYK